MRLDATRADQPFEVRFTPERPLPAGWQLRAIDTGTLHEVDLLKDGRLTGRVVGSPFRRTWRLVAGPVEYQDQARQEATEELTVSIVAFALRPATPNPAPAGEGMTITLEAPRAIEGSLCVYDLRGRMVARLYEGVISQGLTEYRWNGRDGNGREVAAGVYLVRMQGLGWPQ
ncbi:MAG: hypothetical protein IPH48_15330 [bacterium]|nr:hypothetical protein [bacterium]